MGQQLKASLRAVTGTYRSVLEWLEVKQAALQSFLRDIEVLRETLLRLETQELEEQMEKATSPVIKAKIF